MSQDMSNYAVGMDLGTSYSRVAIFQRDQVNIIKNDLDERAIPSYVAFIDTRELIGSAAKNQVATNLNNTVFNMKRLVGKKFCNLKVQSDVGFLPFINEEKIHHITVESEGVKRSFVPEGILSMILSELKKTAEIYLGKAVVSAVVAVPTCFNRKQRKATKTACETAGLNLLRLVDEPHAAAISYGMEKKSDTSENILVIDIGGGSFSVAIVSLDCGVIEVKATGGDDQLGGQDFTNRLVRYFVQKIKKVYNVDSLCDKDAIHRLTTACEQAKKNLSSSTEANIELDSLHKGIDFISSITRTKFEEICEDLFDVIVQQISQLLLDSEISKDEVGDIVLIGGSSQIPKIQKLIRDFLNHKELNTCTIPDEAVASGAAILAAKFTGDKSEAIENLTLLELTPLSLCSVEHDLVDMRIERNTPIPVKCTYKRTTTLNNQTSACTVIYEGERTVVSGNKFLCFVGLYEIPPAPRGKANIEVTLDIDANGVLTVSAVNKDTGKQESTIVTDYLGRLSRKEIKEAVQDSQIHKEFDRDIIKCIKTKNSLEFYCRDQKKACEDELRSMYSDENLQLLKKEVESTLIWLDGFEYFCEPQLEAEQFAHKDNMLRKLFSEKMTHR